MICLQLLIKKFVCAFSISLCVNLLDKLVCNCTNYLTATTGIKNQTTQQTSANFNIDGTGTANVLSAATAVITPAIRVAADSTTALQIQNAGGTSILSVDTSNGYVGIGSGLIAPTVCVQVNDPAGTR
jgi:hypothetical protein